MKVLNEIYKKILINDYTLFKVIEELKKNQNKIVFTNGCFDILHRGHIEYLAKGKELGDILIVAVNSDESVRKLKGNNRPINKLEDRMFLLASLSFVDYVTSFAETTPIEIIKIIKPHIHIKGGDYSIQKLPEREIVEFYGGKVYIIPLIEGYSTTKILSKNQSEH